MTKKAKPIARDARARVIPDHVLHAVDEWHPGDDHHARGDQAERCRAAMEKARTKTAEKPADTGHDESDQHWAQTAASQILAQQGRQNDRNPAHAEGCPVAAEQTAE